MKLARTLLMATFCSTLILNMEVAEARTLDSKKIQIVESVNILSEVFEVDPEIIMACYIENNGRILDSELEFLADEVSWGEEILIEQLIKLTEYKFKDDNRYELVTQSDKDDLAYLVYNKSFVENECLDIYEGWRGDEPSIHIKLKGSYLNLGSEIYKDWSKLIPAPANHQVTETGFRWVINKERLGNKPMRITSQYAYRSNGQMHRALDFATMDYLGENGNYGELNLYPVGNGKIIKVETNPNTSTGLAVWYETKDSYGNLYSVSYMHLSSLNTIEVNQQVTKDTILGTVGSTGDATGVHIHMQVDKNGERVNPLTLWGYDISASEDSRADWIVRNNCVIECMNECTQQLNFTNTDPQFSVVRCDKHRLD